MTCCPCAHLGGPGVAVGSPGQMGRLMDAHLSPVAQPPARWVTLPDAAPGWSFAGCSQEGLVLPS